MTAVAFIIAQPSLALLAAVAISTTFATTGGGPNGIVIDAAGNIYTSNSGSDNISKISPSGNSVILGPTGDQPMGIVIDSAGNLYTPNYNDDNVTKISPLGVQSILGNTGSTPAGIAIDSAGNIYTADANSNTISKITPAGVSTTHGTLFAGRSPQSLVLDPLGNVYTAAYSTDEVWKIAPDGTTSLLGITGSQPYDIAIDSDGNVYTANSGNNTVTKITPLGVSSVYGTTGRDPVGIVVDSAGNVYTTNFLDATVTKITPLGVSSVYGTTGDWPFDIAIDPSGDLYVTNSNGTDTVTRLSLPRATSLAPSMIVTFDSRGGSSVASTSTINGGSVTEPEAPIRKGFSFAGWTTASDGTGTTIAFPYQHTNSADFTLYAQWRPDQSTEPSVNEPIAEEQLPATGDDLVLWPLLMVATGLCLIFLHRVASGREMQKSRILRRSRDFASWWRGEDLNL